jgi:hypothetical protein
MKDPLGPIEQAQFDAVKEAIEKYPRHRRTPSVRRKVVRVEAVAQTYSLTMELECGHELRRTITAKRYAAGFRGPDRPECYECTNAALRQEEGK